MTDPASTIPRADILRLGQQPDPWPFLELLGRALTAAPDDHAVRFLAAANLSKLGLPTLARAQLDELPAPLRAEPQIADLGRTLETIDEHRLDANDRVELCRANLETLAGRAPEATAVFERWAGRAGGRQCFVANDGNVVGRAHDDSDPSRWSGLWNHRRAADSIVDEYSRATKDKRPPITIEGLDPPWMFEAFARMLVPSQSGYWPRIVLIQADPFEFLDGLSLADLRDQLSPTRVHCFIGPDATGRFGTWLEQHAETQQPGSTCSIPMIATPCEPSAEDVLRNLPTANVRDTTNVSGPIHGRTPNRDSAYWAGRFETARAGAPLRVAIITSRFSTYLRHAAQDLASAFRKAGHVAEVLIEPTDDSCITPTGYQRFFDRLEPDLIIANVPRFALAERIPPDVPYVTWIQDVLPCLFDPAAGAAQGPLDFLAGHLHPELFACFGYDRTRSISSPIPVCAEKFHDGPIEPGLASRFECEIAMVTNQSETPDALHQRICDESEPNVQRVIRRIFRRIPPIVESCHVESPYAAATDAAREEFRAEFGTDLNHQDLTRLFKIYTLPLVDRVLRHRVTHWAGQIADRNDWRFHLYGRGWEDHPTLSRFAKGELTHGEDLRGAYQCAAAQLHASPSGVMHQRVFEISLSGGLPICFRSENLVSPRQLLHGFFANTPFDIDPTDDKPGEWIVANHPELAEHMNLRRRLGLNTIDRVPMHPREVARYRAEPLADTPTPAQLLVDPPATTFTSPENLAEIVGHAIDDPRWRDSTSRQIAAIVRDHFTLDSLISRLLVKIRGSLTDSAACVHTAA